MILYINACVRKESRTNRIAKALLQKLGDYDEVKLSSLGLKPVDEGTLQKRTELIAAQNYNDEMFNLAKQFAAADKIVIAAPHWDLSFPSILKIYFENIYVTGIVSKYGDNGQPQGLCGADKLYFVTTSGGPLVDEYGYGYIHALATDYFGIKETQLIKAEMLDIKGMDANEIVQSEIDKLSDMHL